MAKKKYYVVWEGKSCGVFDRWDECKLQIQGFPDAKYKAFESNEEAVNAFRMGYSGFYRSQGARPKQTVCLDTARGAIKKPIFPSIAVDAACSGVPGPVEYQGVDAQTGAKIFHFGPVPDGTNNIGEFLAIVHALALLKNSGSSLPIYSDSITAIAWVRRKKANTHMVVTERNAVLFDLIQRAEAWLKNNPFKNPILKWETSIWGEIPADFGRK